MFNQQSFQPAGFHSRAGVQQNFINNVGKAGTLQSSFKKKTTTFQPTGYVQSFYKPEEVRRNRRMANTITQGGQQHAGNGAQFMNNRNRHFS